MMVYEIYDKVPERFLDYTIENTSLYPKVEFVMDLKGYNDKYNLGFDDQDIKNYNNYYDNVIKRCPTNIELFDLAQSNSEHSRHWFFNAKLTIDGTEEKKTLFDYIWIVQMILKNNIKIFVIKAKIDKFLRII